MTTSSMRLSNVTFILTKLMCTFVSIKVILDNLRELVVWHELPEFRLSEVGLFDASTYPTAKIYFHLPISCYKNILSLSITKVNQVIICAI